MKIGRILCAIGRHLPKVALETEHRMGDQRVVRVTRCERRGCAYRKMTSDLTGWLGGAPGAARASRRRITERATGKRSMPRIEGERHG